MALREFPLPPDPADLARRLAEAEAAARRYRAATRRRALRWRMIRACGWLTVIACIAIAGARIGRA